jgi:AraC-like DNA-binding protein
MTALFFAFLALSHIWYMPLFFITSTESAILYDLAGGILDCMTVFPMSAAVLFAMLQDRERPVLPIIIIMVPLLVLLSLCIITESKDIAMAAFVYYGLIWVVLIIYMVRELKRYSRWLRSNYADLEHKEVWQSAAALFIMLTSFSLYLFVAENVFLEYTLQYVVLIMIIYLLWRVETLSDLSLSQQQQPIPVEKKATEEVNETSETNESKLSPYIMAKMERLLQRNCVDTLLYLQHDLSAEQLAQTIDTNRYYLSRYFSQKGISYNVYINQLRINHFIKLYYEAVDKGKLFTVQQLAQESGYRSYSTFSLAFKQRTGHNVSTWISDASNHVNQENKQSGEL